MSAAQKKLPRNARLLYIHNVLIGILPIVPVFVLYYEDVIGLGFRELMIGEAVFAATILLMEVPTGWLSDVWTRKSTMIAGTLANVAGFTMLWFAHSFLDTLWAQAMIGIGVSLFSGTNSAMLYDSLLECGQERHFRRAEGLRQGLGFYAVGLSSLVGGFFYALDPALPMIATIATSALALVACFLMVEPVRHRVVSQKHPLADMIETTRYALHGHKEIAGIILLSSVLFATTKTLMWAQQPYYMLLDVPVVWFGVLFSISYVIAGLGGHFGHLLDGRFRNVRVLMAGLVFAFVTSLICGLWPGVHGIMLLLFSGTAIYGFCNPRVQDAINNRVDSSRRATILSAASLMMRLISIPLMIIAGQVTQGRGVAVSLLVLAAILGAGGMMALMLIGKNHRARSTMTGT